MELERFIEKLNKQLSVFDINIDQDSAKKLYYYMKELIKWNEKINVTAIVDEEEFLTKHIVDSLLINKYIEKEKTIIDVGTGGGFPGIPIAITNSIKVTLMDAVNKKLNVIKSISSEIDITNIEIIHSRAVASLPTLLEYMMPLVKVGGKVICMKGPSFDTELENAKKAISVLGGKLESVDNYVLEGNNERNIIVIKKVKNTPKNYPRKNGKPNKEPIL